MSVVSLGGRLPSSVVVLVVSVHDYSLLPVVVPDSPREPVVLVPSFSTPVSMCAQIHLPLVCPEYRDWIGSWLFLLFDFDSNAKNAFVSPTPVVRLLCPRLLKLLPSSECC